ncbi:MAG: hypothetical protein AAF518_28235 [Spirochaetota bacterium]
MFINFFLTLVVICAFFIPHKYLLAGNYIYQSAFSARSYAMGGLAPYGSPLVLESNPALLSGISNTTFELGDTYIQAKYGLKSMFIGEELTSSFVNDTNRYVPVHLPYFGVGGRLGSSFHWGIALYIPGGGGGTYKEVANLPSGRSISEAVGHNIATVGDWEIAWKHTNAAFYKVNLTPGISMNVNKRLSIGIAIDAIYGTLQSETFHSLDPNANARLPGVGLRIKGDPAYAAGGKLGFLYRITEMVNFSYSYTTPTSLYTDGGASVNVPNPIYYRKTGVSQKLKFPEAHNIRLAYDSEQLTVGMEIKYIAWSTSQKRTRITLEDPWLEVLGFSTGAATSDNAMGDQRVFIFGLEYQPDWIAYRFGVNLTSNPNAPEGISPITPVVSRHVSAGLGFKTDTWNYDIAVEQGLHSKQYGSPGSNEGLAATARNLNDIQTLRFARYSHATELSTTTISFGVGRKFN